ncbi:adenylosuccinate synthetase [uncultured Caudovirales phage]|uniref:N6-succino-2-amino-2'-deoxyadenylate synthase n=1 Tax=uncultured Caudovirales phage TaxID=2100421 RepID=A0A6J7XL51_9CAUD|nr:adenylosuccinate synthetase [uncultured Caudovirales phage]CAB4202627.1 adenylosuccinate synthetase [uncultured Caudovirales phage]CAB4213991.1 adenylosuccinate synthetase [uncultured Caudovirales phage]CAB5228634.1 adenylosuccinate synthetase [uncultured Caudovirales phage]
MAGRLIAVVGGQYGSEGKGAVAGFLSANSQAAFMGIRVAGPNAGHTVIGKGPNGEESYPWRLRSIPVNAVTAPESDLIIAAGSEIDLEVFNRELSELDQAGYQASSRIIVDEQATVLEPRHHEIEQADGIQARIGSTSKGIGAARADRIMRKASLFGGGVNTSRLVREHLQRGGTALIEGTQGYGLGLHAGLYPFCTSQDCRAVDFLSQVGINPWDRAVDLFDIWVTARTYPIRVAGNSGPLENETSWEQLGLEVERTTVTQKVRRVGHFDAKLVRDAVIANGGAPTVSIALTMFDYIFPELKGKTEVDLSADQREYIHEIEDAVGARVRLIGTGPSTMAWVRP